MSSQVLHSYSQLRKAQQTLNDQISQCDPNSGDYLNRMTYLLAELDKVEKSLKVADKARNNVGSQYYSDSNPAITAAMSLHDTSPITIDDTEPFMVPTSVPTTDRTSLYTATASALTNPTAIPNTSTATPVMSNQITNSAAASSSSSPYPYDNVGASSLQPTSSRSSSTVPLNIEVVEISSDEDTDDNDVEDMTVVASKYLQQNGGTNTSSGSSGSSSHIPFDSEMTVPNFDSPQIPGRYSGSNGTSAIPQHSRYSSTSHQNHPHSNPSSTSSLPSSSSSSLWARPSSHKPIKSLFPLKRDITEVIDLTDDNENIQRTIFMPSSHSRPAHNSQSLEQQKNYDRLLFSPNYQSLPGNQKKDAVRSLMLLTDLKAKLDYKSLETHSQSQQNSILLDRLQEDPSARVQSSPIALRIQSLAMSARIFMEKVRGINSQVAGVNEYFRRLYNGTISDYRTFYAELERFQANTYSQDRMDRLSMNTLNRAGKDSDYYDGFGYMADTGMDREKLEQLLNNIRPDEDIKPEDRIGTPKELEVTLLEHQKLGLSWLQKMEKTVKGGILADDMGLGKTIQLL